MSTPDVDVVIVGQGLAGTALAWELLWRGQRVLVIDRADPQAASRVAAGLITPITGQRLVISWRWSEMWPCAQRFYRQVEQELARSVWQPLKMLRWLRDTSEQQLFQQRCQIPEFQSLVENVAFPPADERFFPALRHAFEMPTAARLDVATYLAGSRERFLAEGHLIAADFDPTNDLQLIDSGVLLPRWGVSALRIVFCQGLAALENPWFRAVRFRPAKGELLTLKISGLSEPRVVHGGVWLAPGHDQHFQCGATYTWDRLDGEPTAAGRHDLLQRLSEFLQANVEVVGHVAGVRPILLHQYPVLGRHPEFSQLGFLNGLGSKGALQAPYLAHHLADVLEGVAPLDAELSVHRHTELRGCRP